MTRVNDATVELAAALEYLREFAWSTAFGPTIGPDTPSAERTLYGQVLLYDRLREAAARINPDLTPSVMRRRSSGHPPVIGRL